MILRGLCQAVPVSYTHLVDKETGKAVPQGDATLKGAVYGLYAREDIVHPDGATGTIYKAGEQVASLTTDDKGQASVNGLYPVSYTHLDVYKRQSIHRLQGLERVPDEP